MSSNIFPCRHIYCNGDMAVGPDSPQMKKHSTVVLKKKVLQYFGINDVGCDLITSGILLN